MERILGIQKTCIFSIETRWTTENNILKYKENWEHFLNNFPLEVRKGRNSLSEKMREEWERRKVALRKVNTPRAHDSMQLTMWTTTLYVFYLCWLLPHSQIFHEILISHDTLQSLLIAVDRWDWHLLTRSRLICQIGDRTTLSIIEF